MREKWCFIRVPVLLVVIFFAGRLVLGAVGVSYDDTNRVFSMVVLQIHIALLWGAAARGYEGYSLKDTLVAIVAIVFVSQSLILIATAASYLSGIDTHFNNPEALNSTTPVEFGPAMMVRLGGLLANCVGGGIAGAFGYALGGLIPKIRHGSTTD
jgi:hypothetical protein